jgi:hypothetical protein
MRCQDAHLLLSADLDAALDRYEAEALDEHLGVCEACQRRRRELRALREALRAPRFRAEKAPARLRAHFAATAARPPAARVRGRRAVLLYAGAVPAAAAAALVWFWLTTSAAALVEHATPGAQVARAGHLQPARSGLRLAAGDRVRVAEGNVRLRLGNRASVSLEHGGELVVSPPRAAARLESGRGSFEVDPGRGEFRIETPVGAVVVTGTAFEIQILKSAGPPPATRDDKPESDMTNKKLVSIGAGAVAATVAVVVHVSRGGVEVQTRDGSASVGKDQTVALIPGTTPSPRALESPGAPNGGRAAAIALAPENAQLKKELAERRAELNETPGPSVRDLVAARNALLKSLSPLERELFEKAKHEVLIDQAKDLRKFCPELVKDDAQIRDDELMAKAQKVRSQALNSADGLVIHGREVNAGDSLAERIVKLTTDHDQTRLRAALEKYLSRERAAEIVEAIRRANL